MSDAATEAHLLLIDDDALLRRMACQTLRHAGFQVTEAGCGEDGLDCFAQHPHDLVLLDLEMPGLSGHEVCARIRASAAGARVPILILTGHNDTGSIDLAYRNGATDFITKPMNWALLSHRVRYALRASRASEAAQRSQDRQARAQRLASLGSWIATLDGQIEGSPELMRLFGMAADMPCSEHDFLARVDEADRQPLAEARRVLAEQGRPYQMEFGIRRQDGAMRRMFEQGVGIVDERGTLQRIEGITQDITERVQAAQRIQQLAHYDSVTGLPNHPFFFELAAPALERARRKGGFCAVMHADIDRFTTINDAFDRDSGDQVLKLISQRLRTWIRGSDLAAAGPAGADQGVLARVGGNAFTLLIEDLAGQEQAAVVARRLAQSISEPITLASQAPSQSLVLTASIGIALFPLDAQDAAGLTRCAEQAMHAAKQAGRAQHRFFDEGLNTRAASRLLMETELRQAIEAGELRLHYQPKVDAASGAWVGAETLVRWQHPQRGLVPPDRFIPLAEESGLIGPLTDWVLTTACRSLRDWARAGLPSLPLSVNLAAPSLADPGLADRLDALTRRFGLLPSALVLEITETMLMLDVESVVVRLQALRTRGYGLSLDDFGTGYSSLGYLKRFPLDELKIDRAFVTDAARGGSDGALATAIIALGHGLGLRVVAEGVETAEQSAFLLRQGCRLQQGFLFSRPISAADFAEGLRRQAQRAVDGVLAHDA
jgi:diguanylate cyclase (GGDEF)-like protein/PAS domain S-box-containing protein